MHIAEVPTPAAVVDLDVVEGNCQRMSTRLAALGVELRPHVKTHKCVELARLQGGHGITVSTLAEARAFFEAGFHDQLLAVPLAPHRIPEALSLGEDMKLSLLVDDARVVSRLDGAARARGQRVPVWLKVDCGYHRSGVDPESPAAVALVRQLNETASLEFQGLLTHAGHSYDCVERSEIARVAAQEVSVTTALAERMRALGFGVSGVSVGSTPTLSVVEDLTGVTEGRPGNYVFHDLHQASIGTCRLQDVALSVLSTVIGVYEDRQSLVLDAGALALSKDAGPTHLDAFRDYGRLSDLEGQPLAGLRLVGLSQEHGKIRVAPGAPAHGLQVGDQVRILPNHSCLVAAQHPVLFVARGQQVVDRWRPVRGWSLH